MENKFKKGNIVIARITKEPVDGQGMNLEGIELSGNNFKKLAALSMIGTIATVGCVVKFCKKGTKKVHNFIKEHKKNKLKGKHFKEA